MDKELEIFKRWFPKCFLEEFETIRISLKMPKVFIVNQNTMFNVEIPTQYHAEWEQYVKDKNNET